jgi:excisionase family DNA binding protein
MFASATAIKRQGDATVTIELLTPQEYAEYRRCSLRTLDRERADGRGCPYVRLGARILYRRSDIDRYMEAHLRGGDWPEGRATAKPQPHRRSRSNAQAAAP